MCEAIVNVLFCYRLNWLHIVYPIILYCIFLTIYPIAVDVTCLSIYQISFKASLFTGRLVRILTKLGSIWLKPHWRNSNILLFIHIVYIVTIYGNQLVLLRQNGFNAEKNTVRIIAGIKTRSDVTNAFSNCASYKYKDKQIANRSFNVQNIF